MSIHLISLISSSATYVDLNISIRNRNTDTIDKLQKKIMINYEKEFIFDMEKLSIKTKHFLLITNTEDIDKVGLTNKLEINQDAIGEHETALNRNFTKIGLVILFFTYKYFSTAESEVKFKKKYFELAPSDIIDDDTTRGLSGRDTNNRLGIRRLEDLTEDNIRVMATGYELDAAAIDSISKFAKTIGSEENPLKAHIFLEQ